MRGILFVCLASGLAACAGQATQQSGRGNAPAVQLTGPCTIVAFGDSLTSGIGETASAPYTTFLERRMRAEGFPCEVINAGLPGDTTARARERVRGVAARRPLVAIVELGGNDALTMRPVARIEDDLAAIVETLSQAGARVVIAGVELPSPYDAHYAEQLRGMFANLSRRYDVDLVPSILSGVAERGLVLADGIHPTIAGHERMADTVYQAVISAVTAAQARGGDPMSTGRQAR